jgi:predicted RNA binding protein YcfA (HicA-like mRNA interferase family)
MKSISGKKLCKIVEKKGWILKKITGSHHIYEKNNENKIISIPVHRNQS